MLHPLRLTNRPNSSSVEFRNPITVGRCHAMSTMSCLVGSRPRFRGSLSVFVTLFSCRRKYDFMAWLAVETAHPEQHESLRRVQRNASGELTGCIVLHNWEISLANLAASNLKRSRTLPNRSREDRIRDWQLKRPR